MRESGGQSHGINIEEEVNGKEMQKYENLVLAAKLAGRMIKHSLFSA
jgi:hypothetical protein